MGKRWTGAIAFFACFAVLAFVWAMSNAPFTAPDEAAHYLRALGVSDGHLLGRRAELAPPGLASILVLPQEPSRLQLRWVNQATREVAVPDGLSTVGYNCDVLQPVVSAACLRSVRPNRRPIDEISSVGTYQPLPYLLPAAVMRADGHAPGALRLARLATAAMWLALLAVAIFALWDSGVGVFCLGGLALSLTPTVVFLGSSLNGSALEVMGSISFFATLLGIVRADPAGPRLRVLIVLAGATGLGLALSRSLGPLWVVLDLVLATIFLGRSRLRLLWSSNRSRLMFAALAAVAGIVLNRYWEALYGPHAKLTLLPGAHALREAVKALIRTQPQLIASFGYLNVHPRVPEVLWWLLVAGVVVMALVRIRGRGRTAMLVALVLFVLGPIYLYAAVLSNTGFALQGRHYLPLAALLPLFAFDLLRDQLAAHPRRQLAFAAVASTLVVLQIWSWWENAVHWAVGPSGPIWFLSGAAWSPPLGWAPWVALMLVGGGLLLVVIWRDWLPGMSSRRGRNAKAIEA